MAFFSQDPVFYDLLEAQADAACRAAQSFAALTQDFAQADSCAQALKKIEADADKLTHELVNKADAKFVTPLDKEDMHHLSESLDSITDHLEAAGARVSLYQLTQVRPDLPPMADILVRTTEATREAVGILRHLKDHKSLEEVFVKVHALENESDQAYRTALGALFNEPNADPLHVMKWKELYDRVELTVDECENVADILESLVVKYA